MSKFKDIISKRRSCRAFVKKEIKSDDVRLILRAALMSPTSMGKQSWQFIVVDDNILLEKLADSKDRGADFLRSVAFAVVVLDSPIYNDCWIEDCSIAAFAMQLQATDLGIGSCWAQIRGRGLSDGTLSKDVIQGILNVPSNLEPLCIIGFGYKQNEKDPHDENSLKWENVQINKYKNR